LGIDRDGVTIMTEPRGYVPDGLWSVDDLQHLPDHGMRYELVDGTLLVSPHPFVPHAYTIHRLRRLLERQAPDGVEVGQNAGVLIGSRHTCFVPDLFVTSTTAFEQIGSYLEPADLRLVVEVLSDGNRGVDLVLKRHYYASVRIPRYWIVDRRDKTLTVHSLAGAEYQVETTIEEGTTWHAEHPFPLTLDPAQFC